jgi:cytochrome oxidase assembly protein ShyY1
LRWWSARLWGAHLIALVAVVVTVLLGWWQWSVSQGHKADKSESLAHATPVPLNDVFGHNDAFPGEQTGRPALLEGTWIPSGTVFVSGHQGGYWVATPLQVGATGASTSAATSAAIYVVRGWTDEPSHAPAAPSGTAKLVGWLQPPEDGGLTDDHPHDDVLPELNIADAMSHVEQDLYSGYAVVADAEPGWPAADAAVNDGSTGLKAAQLNALPEASFTTGLRNALYALEWWIFSLFAIYLWWRYVRDATSPRPAPEATPESHDDPVPSGS